MEIIENDSHDIIVEYDEEVVRVELKTSDLGHAVYNAIYEYKHEKPITTVKYVYMNGMVIEIISLISQLQEPIINARLKQLRLSPENFGPLVYKYLSENADLNPIVNVRYHYNSTNFIIAVLNCKVDSSSNQQLDRMSQSQNSILDDFNPGFNSSPTPVRDYAGVNRFSPIQTRSRTAANRIIAEAQALAYESVVQNQILNSNIRVRTISVSSLNSDDSVLYSECSTVC